jgi:hypothetical protein
MRGSRAGIVSAARGSAGSITGAAEAAALAALPIGGMTRGSCAGSSGCVVCWALLPHASDAAATMSADEMTRPAIHLV